MSKPKKKDGGPARVPEVRVDFHLDGIGYQVELFLDGRLFCAECRDLDSDDIRAQQVWLMDRIGRLVTRFRQAFR